MKIKFAFWGTDEFSTGVLDELQNADLIPSLIITAPDRPSGRGQKMQKPPVALWAEKNNVPFVQPEKLDAEFVANLKSEEWPLFTLASYGKILPDAILQIPERGFLNVHPSLLPKYRGASPIESAMLSDDKETGVTIMMMDSEMDHGPIVSQEGTFFNEWPNRMHVENELSHLGGQMLADAINAVMQDEANIREQNHDDATFTKKIKKEDGKINFEDLKNPDAAREIFLKVKALNPWPGVYFMMSHTQHGEQKEIRVKILDADFETNDAGQFLKIKTVVPEGRKPMSWEDFQKGFLPTKA